MDLKSQLERVTGVPLPHNLIDKVTRKAPGMGDSTNASDSDSDYLLSFITTSLDSRNQQAASSPPPNAWDKPMNEVSIALTYKFASFSANSSQTLPKLPQQPHWHPTTNMLPFNPPLPNLIPTTPRMNQSRMNSRHN